MNIMMCSSSAGSLCPSAMARPPGVAWGVVRHMWEDTLGQPRVTPQEHVRGFLLCYILPTAVNYASNACLARQFAKICRQTHKAKLLEDEDGGNCGQALDRSSPSSAETPAGAAAAAEPNQASPGVAAAQVAASMPLAAARPVQGESAASVAGSSTHQAPAGPQPVTLASASFPQPSTREQDSAAPAQERAAHGESNSLLRRMLLSEACSAAAVVPAASGRTCPLYRSPLKHMWLTVKVSTLKFRMIRRPGTGCL